MCSYSSHAAFKYMVIIRNSSCGKVMFSQVSVKNSVHGGLPHCMLWYTPLGRHPLGRHLPANPPGRHLQVRHPLGRHCHRHPLADTLLPQGWPLQQTVRIILECILVNWCYRHSNSGVGSVATRTLEWKVKIHQHLLNHSWLNFKMCLFH